MRTLNLGILAHVDAGKTSLTERLLFDAGAISALGSVDAGDTQTDSLDLERRRGITIKSAVVSFTVPDGLDELVVNLIDTPGHPDFIAEVERVLGVLDAAVLVVSAVEGVQSQTRVLSRALRRLQRPVLLFVNKVDRLGARPAEVVEEIRERLDLQPIVLGSVQNAGRGDARYLPARLDDRRCREAWAAALADRDDEVLQAWLDGHLVGRTLDEALARQVLGGDVQPLIFGSATTGTGVADLRAALPQLAPRVAGRADDPLRAQVFAVQRDDRERVVLARVFAGVLRVRERVSLGQQQGKITALDLVHTGGHHPVESVSPGRIARVHGMAAARIGDTITAGDDDCITRPRAFAPPSLETVVTPVDPRQGAALFNALSELADQDPLINFRRGREDALTVSLYGEVQKEVIGATLDDQYGVQTRFTTTRPICVEAVTGTAESITRLSQAGNPFLAGVGLRIEPGAPGSGLSYRVDGFMLGTMPASFFTAVEETVHATLQEGLHGWRVIDAVVTLIHTGYYPRQSHAHATFDKSMSSTAGDFRLLTPLVIMEALRRAGTAVLEPMHRFVLQLPYACLNGVLSMITAAGGSPSAEPHGREWRICGEIPAAAVHLVNQRLPGLTSGEGAWESTPAGHRPVVGAVPERARTDPDPLQRKEYLLHVQRRQLTG